MARSRKYKAFGRELTLRAWAKHPRCRVTYQVLHKRVVTGGWTIKRALTTPLGKRGRPGTKVTVWGVTYESIAALVKEDFCQCRSRQVVHGRLREGWTPEEAVAVPAHATRAEARSAALQEAYRRQQGTLRQDGRDAIQAKEIPVAPLEEIRATISSSFEKPAQVEQPQAVPDDRSTTEEQCSAVVSSSSKPETEQEQTASKEEEEGMSENISAEDTSQEVAAEQPVNDEPHIELGDEELLEAFGEVKTLQQWMADERCCVTIETATERLAKGWDVDAAVATCSEWPEGTDWYRALACPPGAVVAWGQIFPSISALTWDKRCTARYPRATRTRRRLAEGKEPMAAAAGSKDIYCDAQYDPDEQSIIAWGKHYRLLCHVGKENRCVVNYQPVNNRVRKYGLTVAEAASLPAQDSRLYTKMASKLIGIRLVPEGIQRQLQNGIGVPLSKVRAIRYLIALASHPLVRNNNLSYECVRDRVLFRGWPLWAAATHPNGNHARRLRYRADGSVPVVAWERLFLSVGELAQDPWCRVNIKTLQRRLYCGWTPESATQPIDLTFREAEDKAYEEWPRHYQRHAAIRRRQVAENIAALRDLSSRRAVSVKVGEDERPAAPEPTTHVREDDDTIVVRRTVRRNGVAAPTKPAEVELEKGEEPAKQDDPASTDAPAALQQAVQQPTSPSIDVPSSTTTTKQDNQTDNRNTNNTENDNMTTTTQTTEKTNGRAIDFRTPASRALGAAAVLHSYYDLIGEVQELPRVGGAVWTGGYVRTILTVVSLGGRLQWSAIIVLTDHGRVFNASAEEGDTAIAKASATEVQTRVRAVYEKHVARLQARIARLQSHIPRICKGDHGNPIETETTV